jgi:hypothetical protein
LVSLQELEDIQWDFRLGQCLIKPSLGRLQAIKKSLTIALTNPLFGWGLARIASYGGF